MFRLLTILTAFSVVLCPAPGMAAQNQQPQLAGSRQIVLSATDYPGKETYSQHPYTDLVRAALQRLGYSLRVTHAPGLRSLVMANNGVVDGELVRVKDLSDDYPNLIMVPEPLGNPSSLVLVTARDAAPADGHWTQMTAHTLVAIKGLVLMDYLPAQFAALPQMQAQNFRQAMQILIAGRADLALMPASLFERDDLAELAQELMPLQPVIAELQGYVHLHKRHAQLVQPLADAMASVKADAARRDSLAK